MAERHRVLAGERQSRQRADEQAAERDHDHVDDEAHAAAPGGTLRPRVLLALRQAPVAADVAVLATDDHVHGVLVPDVADLAHRRRVHPREAAGTEHVLRAVAELELDRAAVDEVGLLLLVVEVPAGLVARRHGDRVHAEGRHAQLTPDLAKAVALADGVDAGDGIAVAGDHLVHWFGCHQASIVQRRTIKLILVSFSLRAAGVVLVAAAALASCGEDQNGRDPLGRPHPSAIPSSSCGSTSPRSRAATRVLPAG